MNRQEQRNEVDRLRKCNWMFRELEKSLDPKTSNAKRLALFNTVRKIAERVMQRTMDDLIRVV